MTHQEYNPGEGSVEDLWEQATGAAPRTKRKKKRVWKATADFAPRPKGYVVDRSDPDYQKVLQAARKGMPEFDAISFMEAVLFDNGEKRQRGVPRYQIKLGWTCAPPGVVAKADRSQHLTVRYIPLAVRTQARDNWNRKRRKQGAFRFEPEERAVLDGLMEGMRDHDAERVEGQPLAMIGCLQHRFGAEGTIRHCMFGVVMWHRPAGIWLPRLLLVRSTTGEPIETRDRATGTKRPTIDMEPGRGDGVVAYGSHYGDSMLVHMRVPYVADLVAENLRRMAA